VLFRADYIIYTLPIFDRIKVRVSVRFIVQIKYSNSMILKNSLSASWPVRELSSPRLDWPRVGLSASCPVSVYPAWGGGLRSCLACHSASKYQMWHKWRRCFHQTLAKVNLRSIVSSYGWDSYLGCNICLKIIVIACQQTVQFSS